MHATSFSDEVLCRLRRKLTSWYCRHGRSLPWRETRDPFRIWVSEIMLQQTTVKAVVPYFERFLARFPTIADLAAATEEDVLRMWEGLGYYSRGRNLRHAAIAIHEHYGGEFPRDVTRLQSLPGIGRYTAGAIASFAFDLPAPIVEANTQRLYCRLLGFDGEPTSSTGQKLLWDFAETLLPHTGAGQVNQALMELGSQVCTPTSPRCDECPLSHCCAAFAAGTQARIPHPKQRPDVTAVVDACLVVRYRDRLLLRQRTDGERWAGLWDFPRYEVTGVAHRGNVSRQELSTIRNQLQRRMRDDWSLAVTVDSLVREIRHSVTRYRIRLLCMEALVNARRLPKLKQGQWVQLEDLESFPLSMTARKLADHLLASAGEKTLFQ